MHSIKKKIDKKGGHQNQQVGRNWTGTYFSTELQKGVDIMLESCHYFIGQIEQCPDTNREHLQWFAHFDSNQRLSKLQSLLPGCHAELARNTQACIEYCSKNDSRLRGPYTRGIPPQVRQLTGKKLTVNEAMQLSEEQLRELPLHSFIASKKAISLCLYEPLATQNTRGEWYHGKPGTGKSHAARTKYPGAYIKMQTKWFDGYTVQPSILLDDLDIVKGSALSFELGHLLKIVADKYGCFGEIKGGTVALRHETFIVTSNYLPEDIWDDYSMQQAIRRRFNFTSFKDEFNVLESTRTSTEQESTII